MGNQDCWSLLWPHFSQDLPHCGCTSQRRRVRPLMCPGQSPAQKSSRWSTAANCCREQCLQPSLPFQKDISQTREKSSGGCSPPYPGEKRWIQLKHDFACWNLLSQEQKIKFHSWVLMPRCLKDELSLFLEGFLQAVFRNPAGQSAQHSSLREAANEGETRYNMNKNRTKLVTPTGSGDMFSQQSWFSCSQLFLVYGERQRVKFCLTYHRFLV